MKSTKMHDFTFNSHFSRWFLQLQFFLNINTALKEIKWKWFCYCGCSIEMTCQFTQTNFGRTRSSSYLFYFSFNFHIVIISISLVNCSDVDNNISLWNRRKTKKKLNPDISLNQSPPSHIFFMLKNEDSANSVWLNWLLLCAAYISTTFEFDPLLCW